MSDAKKGATMRRLRLGIVLVTGLLGVLLSAGPASAGGAIFSPAEDRYEPGEVATMVGYAHNVGDGWVADGPFYAFLRTEPTLDFDKRADLPLGELLLQDTGGGSVRAAVTFTIPADLPTGPHQFDYCNRDCTKRLGDLTWGVLWVGADPTEPISRAGWRADDPALQGAPASVSLPPLPPTTAVPPPLPTAAPPTTQARSAPPLLAPPVLAPAEDDGSSLPWVPIGAGAVLVAVLAVSVLRRRAPGAPAPHSRTPGTPRPRRAADRTPELVGAGTRRGPSGDQPSGPAV